MEIPGLSLGFQGYLFVSLWHGESGITLRHYQHNWRILYDTLIDLFSTSSFYLSLMSLGVALVLT